jgi:tetratricopeptide (TPR) repeat protein
LNERRVGGIEDGLSEREWAFVRALSVFAGGFSLDAAKTVGSEDSQGAEQLLTALVERSIVRRRDTRSVRYALDDVVWERAQQALRASGEDDAVRARHLEWARALAEQGSAALDGPGQQTWLDAFELEHDNFRAALLWGTTSRDRESALALAASLGRFWEVRGYAREGRQWLETAMRQNPGASAVTRANAANSAGLLAFRDHDYAGAKAFYEESLALHWELGDRLGSTGVLHALGNIAFQQRDWKEAQRLFEESLAIGRDVRDDRVIAASLTNLGAIAEVAGDNATALAQYQEALALWRTLGDRFNEAAVLGNLTTVAVATGDFATARGLAAETLEARRVVGDRTGMIAALRQLATIAAHQGDHAAARSFEEERRRLTGQGEGGWMARFLRRRMP